MAQKAKKLVQEKGILSLPDLKVGPLLLPETVSTVREFYESDDISRIMPGKRNFVSIRQKGKRVHFQNRLILSNLREAFEEFKSIFPNHKVGFSKFAEFRPKHCVLVRASGTHSVCVFTIHQNVKLMMNSIHLSSISTYHSGSASIVCNPPLPKCFFLVTAVCVKE